MVDRLLPTRWSDGPKILCSPAFFQRVMCQQLHAASCRSRTHRGVPASDGAPLPRFSRYVLEGARNTSVQGEQPMQSIHYWEPPTGSSSQRRKEEGTSPLAKGCLHTTTLRGSAIAHRPFSSAGAPDPGHVMLSKERLDQLLLAEITEFALRPSRPLTLEQIAFLNQPHKQQSHQKQQYEKHRSARSDGNGIKGSQDVLAEGTQAPVGASMAASSPMRPASASCRAVLGTETLIDAGGTPSWVPLRATQGAEDRLGDANSFAEFLYHELPVRFASRVKQLETLPFFHTDPLIMQVRHTYVESFKQLRSSCVKDPEQFRKVVLDLKRRHAPIVPMVVTGMRHLREVAPQFFTEKFVDEFLDAFFLSRIGTEMLTSSYLTPHGVVDMACDPFEVTRRAAEDAEKLCHSHYGTCPQIKIWNFNAAHFASVPQYLYYILSELLKNAMRATMEHFPPFPSEDAADSLATDGRQRPRHPHPDRWEAEHAGLVPCDRKNRRDMGGARLNQVAPHYQTAPELADPNMPPVQLLVAGDDHSISIRLSDMGGGITAEAQPRIWSYMYTTAKPVKYDPLTGAVVCAAPRQQQRDTDDESLKQSVTIGSLDFTTQAESKQLMASPLAGFGCGLPLCRLYASYLGGNLTFVSMPVYGTDAYIQLRRIGDQEELMPSDVWLKPNVHSQPAPASQRNRMDPFGAPRADNSNIQRSLR